jgi:hypothetical protein
MKLALLSVVPVTPGLTLDLDATRLLNRLEPMPSGVTAAGVTCKVGRDHDALLTRANVDAAERRDGRIPEP